MILGEENDMRSHRRGNLHSRLAGLERQAGVAHDEEAVPQVAVYMPHNERDPQPCGVLWENRWTRFILYDANTTDPARTGP